MHAFFAPFGIYPNNAIVGGSGSIAPGAALFKRVNRKPGIVVANIGDASFGCGPVWEGITFSAMDQYRTLWDEVAGRRPADHLQLHEQLLRHGRPAARRDHGRAVHRPHRRRRQSRADARRARQRLRSAARDRRLPPQEADARRKAAGPVLLDTVTYRISGHSPSDASSYRSKEEIERWQQADSIRAFRAKLIEQPTRSTEDAAGQRQGVHRSRGLRHVPARDRSRSEPARRPRFRAGRLGHVLQPPRGEVRRPRARVPAGPGREPARAADSRQDPHRQRTKASRCRR